MKITNCAINIEDSTLADRLRLRQVLLDNEQFIYSNIENSQYDTNANYILKYSNGWIGSHIRLPNITLKNFVQKFKKHDQIRGLAFYKKDKTSWTQEEFENIQSFCGDSVHDEIPLECKYIYDSDRSADMYPWVIQCKEDIEQCLKLAYEDVFPKTDDLNIDYWQAKYEAGEDVYMKNIFNKVFLCKIYSPLEWPNPKAFYDHDPRVAEKLTQEENKKEQEMSIQTKEMPTQVNSTLLKLLVELMIAPETKNSTNSKYVGILSSKNGEYLGYIYFDEKEEAISIMQKPENEGNILNYFKYKGTFTQKPRDVIETVRD